MYEKSSVFGTIFNKVLQGTMLLAGEDIEIYSTPLYFDENSNSSYTYSWYLDGSKISLNENVSSLVFGREEGAEGTSKISSKITDSNNLYSRGSNSFSIKYSDTINQ